MDHDIRAIGRRLTDGFRDLVARRVETALDRFDSRIQSVAIRLADVNGPKGGRDKRCLIAITGRGLSRIRVQAEADTWRGAVDLAAERASRAVARRIDAKRAKRVSAQRALLRRR